MTVTSDFMRECEQLPIQERRNVFATKPRVRRLNQRQRKKLRVGEFQELIFEISVSFKTELDLSDWDIFIDDFCEHVASHGLGLCGFGGSMPLAATEGWIHTRGRGSPTGAQCQELINWLKNRKEVMEASPGSWVDAWYGCQPIESEAEFVRRGRAAIQRTIAKDDGIPAAVVIAKLEAKVNAARKREVNQTVGNRDQA